MPVMAHALPEGFSYLRDVAPTIKQKMMYFDHENFVGRRVKGYEASKCILATKAAKKLKEVQRELQPTGLSLIVYDCYRPKKAVKDFIEYAKLSDISTKAQFYPNLADKHSLFREGYVSYNSRHSGGATVDLALIAADKNSYYVGCMRPARDLAIDFGSGVDCLDPIAHTKSHKINDGAMKYRKYLVALMSRHGFKNYPKEWWHYTLRSEPYPYQAFDFPIK